MKLPLRIVVDGVERVVTAQPTDIVAFERQYKMGLQSMGADPRVEHLAWLAWHVERRHKNTVLDFESWLDGMDELEMGDTPDPLPVAPSD